MTDEKPDFWKRLGAAVQQHYSRCYKCKAPIPGSKAEAGDWGIRLRGVVCPECQTPEERAEIAIRQATIGYTLENDRFVGPPDDEEDDQEHPHSA